MSFLLRTHYHISGLIFQFAFWNSCETFLNIVWDSQIFRKYTMKSSMLNCRLNIFRYPYILDSTILRNVNEIFINQNGILTNSYWFSSTVNEFPVCFFVSISLWWNRGSTKITSLKVLYTTVHHHFFLLSLSGSLRTIHTE